MSLEKHRSNIDAIDKKILGLLGRRAKEVKQITSLKKEGQIPTYSAEREAQILRRLSAHGQGDLSREDIEAVFSEIMSVCRGLHAGLRIAYFGPEGTFTHMAALKKFGKKPDFIPYDTISDVFEAVERGEADYGVVPVENSTEGVVNHTLDMFFTSSLQICDQITISVSQCLISRADISKVKKIYSKQIVFGQCRKWLATNMPHVQLVDCISTAKAAQIAAKDKNAACIGNKILADIYGLKTLRSGIEDSARNYTRFFVIAPKDSLPSGKDKTSLLLTIKDRVGALHDILASFKKVGINLTKIESRPSKEKPWEYRFFVDFEGHRLNDNVKKVLVDLARHCTLVKILGSYPA